MHVNVDRKVLAGHTLVVICDLLGLQGEATSRDVFWPFCVCTCLFLQIELYSHVGAIRSLLDRLRSCALLCVCSYLPTHVCALPVSMQIELYSHVGAIRSLVDWLRSEGWSVAAVFCMDVAFVNEPSKYIAGAMQVG